MVDVADAVVCLSGPPAGAPLPATTAIDGRNQPGRTLCFPPIRWSPGVGGGSPPRTARQKKG
jgi:hypothetical protein